MINKDIDIPGQKNSCAVLIPSYDPYSDLWKPFFNLFFRYWNDCPYPVYLGANKLSYEDPRVRMLYTDKRNWSDGLIEMVHSINSEYIVLFLEDFFLQDKIDQADIDYCLDFMNRNQAHYMRVRTLPGPDKKIPGEKKIGLIEAGHPYRVSMQVSIWRKSSLLKLLKPGESIWQFETDGSVRSSELFPDGFYGIWKNAMPYKYHVVERGKWFPWEAKKFKKMDIGCDFSKRPVMNQGEALRWYRDRYLGMLINFISSKKIAGNK